MADHQPLVMLSAGEASGDLHAASLFRELEQRLPGIRGIGMGATAMREAGVELVYDSSGIGVIGLQEIARHYLEIKRALKLMIQTVKERRPDLLICVDYKEFNFRLAKAAKAEGIKVLFYVSPQVWAWRPGRVKKYGRAIDHMAVIFPFEVPFYQKHGIPVSYVGHPLAGKVRAELKLTEALEKYRLADAKPVIGLLPGSRTNEIRRLLPVILESAERLSEQHPGVRFLLFQAASVKDEELTRQLAGRKLSIDIIRGRDYDALQCCNAVMTVSGTATLELALLGLPMVIVYRLSPISYGLGRLLVSIPWIGLPNILAGKGIVREYIQHEANAANIVAEINRILEDPDYASTIRMDLAEVREKLGQMNGSAKLAELAAQLLENPRLTAPGP